MSANYTFTWPRGPTEVTLTGTFDNWGKSLPLVKQADGSFSLTVPLPPTEKKLYYKYIVDGNWKVSPSDRSEIDSNGVENNVLETSDLILASSGVPGLWVPESGGLVLAVPVVDGTEPKLNTDKGHASSNHSDSVKATVMPKESQERSIAGEPGIQIPSDPEALAAFTKIEPPRPTETETVERSSDDPKQGLGAAERKKAKRAKYKSKKKAAKRSSNGATPSSSSDGDDGIEPSKSTDKESDQDATTSPAVPKSASAGVEFATIGDAIPQSEIVTAPLAKDAPKDADKTPVKQSEKSITSGSPVGVSSDKFEEQKDAKAPTKDAEQKDSKEATNDAETDSNTSVKDAIVGAASAVPIIGAAVPAIISKEKSETTPTSEETDVDTTKDATVPTKNDNVGASATLSTETITAEDVFASPKESKAAKSANDTGAGFSSSDADSAKGFGPNLAGLAANDKEAASSNVEDISAKEIAKSPSKNESFDFGSGSHSRNVAADTTESTTAPSNVPGTLQSVGLIEAPAYNDVVTSPPILPAEKKPVSDVAAKNVPASSLGVESTDLGVGAVPSEAAAEYGAHIASTGRAAQANEVAKEEIANVSEPSEVVSKDAIGAAPVSTSAVNSAPQGGHAHPKTLDPKSEVVGVIDVPKVVPLAEKKPEEIVIAEGGNREQIAAAIEASTGCHVELEEVHPSQQEAERLTREANEKLDADNVATEAAAHAAKADDVAGLAAGHALAADTAANNAVSTADDAALVANDAAADADAAAVVAENAAANADDVHGLPAANEPNPSTVNAQNETASTAAVSSKQETKSAPEAAKEESTDGKKRKNRMSRIFKKLFH